VSVWRLRFFSFAFQKRIFSEKRNELFSLQTRITLCFLFIGFKINACLDNFRGNKKIVSGRKPKVTNYILPCLGVYKGCQTTCYFLKCIVSKVIMFPCMSNFVSVNTHLKSYA
jgi:hypothetical protein